MGGVKATLRKRWRHKAERGTDIFKALLKIRHKTTTGGMKGAAALNQPQTRHHSLGRSPSSLLPVCVSQALKSHQDKDNECGAEHMAELCPPLPSHCGGPGLPLMERWSCPSLTSEFLGGVVQVSSRRLHHTPIIHQPEEDKKKKSGAGSGTAGWQRG